MSGFVGPSVRCSSRPVKPYLLLLAFEGLLIQKSLLWGRAGPSLLLAVVFLERPGVRELSVRRLAESLLAFSLLADMLSEASKESALEKEGSTPTCFPDGQRAPALASLRPLGGLRVWR